MNGQKSSAVSSQRTLQESVADLHQKTWKWTDEARSVGFNAQAPQIGALYLVTEVAEVFEAWLRENTDAVRRNSKKFDMAKELCDVVMMSLLSVPRNIEVKSTKSPSSFTIKDLLAHASSIVQLWDVVDDIYKNRADERYWQEDYMSWLVVIAEEACDSAYVALMMLHSMDLDPVSEYDRHLAERYKMMGDKQKRQSRWIHKSAIATYIGDKVAKLEGQKQMTMDEIAIVYMAEELKRNGKIMSKIAGQQAITVPDSDCVEVYEMYGSLLEKEANLIESLSELGFSGKLEDVPTWLRSLVEKNEQNNVGSNADNG